MPTNLDAINLTSGANNNNQNENCLDVYSHIESCHLCAQFYRRGFNTCYLIIFFLIIVIIILWRRKNF